MRVFLRVHPNKNMKGLLPDVNIDNPFWTGHGFKAK